MESQSHINKLSAAGLLVTLGIIYGDIGTSPLYVMNALVDGRVITETLVLGGVSAVFWTLTLQTTIKYVLLTLQADNKGEGGIFSIFTLLRRRYPYLIIGTLVGGAMLLADGMITPPISVSSAIEGLRLINPNLDTVPIIIVIIIGIFMFQRAGTSAVGKAFGPIMLVWFGMLAVLGFSQIANNPGVFKAINPIYAYRLLSSSSEAYLLLGAVFLCTTGAEALYSDLGHCGKKNIRMSWIFVKICLILNYFGQAAWLLNHMGQVIPSNQSVFYNLMPHWFLIIGIVIATLAAIIASQALISGSFTLVAEAIRLHFLPKFKVKFPTKFKGQIYIPIANTALLMGCIAVVLIFKTSKNMEAAYGLAITITMLMTSILLFFYLKSIKNWNIILLLVTMAVFFTVEGGFLYANLAKFSHGGYVTVLMGLAILSLFYICYYGGKIKQKLASVVPLKNYSAKLVALGKDRNFPKYATHLIYLSKVRETKLVEPNILYSILQKRPKRADYYYFMHVDVSDEPYTQEYTVHIIAPDVIKVNFILGFRVPQKMSFYMKLVIADLIKKGEITVVPYQHSFDNEDNLGDLRFVLIDDEISSESELTVMDSFILKAYNMVRKTASSPDKWFGLDESMVTHELVPVLVNKANRTKLLRVN
jgi:KUP system potassium uptake protein